MQNTLVLSFLAVRKSIGLIGLALPCLLLLGTLTPTVTMQASLSQFYHTDMRDIFVGILTALGVFLIAYKGYDPRSPKLITDKNISTLAGIGAIGTALFPTTNAIATDIPEPSIAHILFATLFFTMSAILCLVLFTKSGGDISPEKRQRNRIYRICGITILTMIALIAYLFLTEPDTGIPNPIFWAESIAVWSFGLSWLVKGEGIGLLNDDP